MYVFSVDSALVSVDIHRRYTTQGCRAAFQKIRPVAVVVIAILDDKIFTSCCGRISKLCIIAAGARIVDELTVAIGIIESDTRTGWHVFDESVLHGIFGICFELYFPMFLHTHVRYKFDWNTSYILPAGWMSNPTSSVYAPSYAYTAPFGYEHHWIEFLLTADETGFANTKVNNLSVSQNQPNPFNGTTTINYTLNTKENVSLVVYNVAGAKVMELSEGVKVAGTHTIQLNAGQLNAGVYYYTVNAGDNSLTKKMIVY